MKYLIPQDILVIHARVIDVTGGAHGVRDVGLLISATERPKASFGGHESYSTAFNKAATYIESLVRYHVFVDGNKRTSFVSAARFLHLNTYTFEASNAEAERFILKVATDRLNIASIAAWLRRHAKKIRK